MGFDQPIKPSTTTTNDAGADHRLVDQIWWNVCDSEEFRSQMKMISKVGVMRMERNRSVHSVRGKKRLLTN